MSVAKRRLLGALIKLTQCVKKTDTIWNNDKNTIKTPDFQKFLKKQKDSKLTVKGCCEQLDISRATWHNRVYEVI